MKIRTVIGIAALAFGAPGIASADDGASQNAVPYHYGMPLHVAKVLRLTEPDTMDCKVVTANMKYIDTSGKTAQITYKKLAEACSYQN